MGDDLVEALGKISGFLSFAYGSDASGDSSLPVVKVAIASQGCQNLTQVS